MTGVPPGRHGRAGPVRRADERAVEVPGEWAQRSEAIFEMSSVLSSGVIACTLSRVMTSV
jgi:hypothetical protein